jgi:hypothetical protein
MRGNRGARSQQLMTQDLHLAACSRQLRVQPNRCGGKFLRSLSKFFREAHFFFLFLFQFFSVSAFQRFSVSAFLVSFFFQ